MNKKSEENNMDDKIVSLVPSTTAYFVAWFSLAISGVAGGFIGYALLKVFFPGFNSISMIIGTLIVTVLIVYAMSVLTSLSLQASVEWKARENKLKNSQRPSRLIK